MAILKAATWQSSGNKSSRRVSWGSSSEKVEQPSVDFTGKLILLTNVVPAGKETEAFLSRCLSYRISISDDEVAKMLLNAASAKEHFPKFKLALEVSRFLTEDATGVDLSRVNLRTLKMGYDLAMTHPEHWKGLFVQLLPLRVKASNVISNLLLSGLPTKEQEARFVASTGMSRRSYYNHKKRLGLTRSYQRK